MHNVITYNCLFLSYINNLTQILVIYFYVFNNKSYLNVTTN